MICPKCNTMNPNSIKKCIKCGEKLEKTTGGAAIKNTAQQSGPMLKKKEVSVKPQKQPKIAGEEKKGKGFFMVLLLLLMASVTVFWMQKDMVMEYFAVEQTDSLLVAEEEIDEEVDYHREERRARRDTLYESISDADKAQLHKRKKTYDESFYYSKDGKKMILIPGQTFKMGSNKGSDIERPEHSVRVIDFYLDETEVTNLQFKKFLEETEYKPKGSLSHLRDRRFNKDDMPVINVDYEDALAYAKWSEKRLPTEIEWECAAKGGKNNEYPTGSDMTENQARFGLNITVGSTVSVKSYKPNEYGIYDLAGNASEWVQGVLYQYTGNETRSRYYGSARVPRGGSWLSSKDDCKSYRRAILDISKDLNNIGFRCAISRDEVIELINR